MLSKIIGTAALFLVLGTQMNARSLFYKTCFTQGVQINNFSGTFKGHANMADYYLSIQNNNGQVTGKFLTSSNEVFTVEGKMVTQNEVSALFEGTGGNLKCNLSKSGSNVILELDKEFMASAKLLLVLAGEYEAALAMEDTVVMTPFKN